MVVYFAYGSNMLTARLRERVASARVITTGWLPGHSLRFHKKGADNSGKADAYFTGSATDTVHGVLYALTQADRKRLDLIERGYDAVPVDVQTTEGKLSAIIYRAKPTARDPHLPPFDWYRDLISAGAREHDLPAELIQQLQALPVTADPDRQRTAAARKLLQRTA